ncbi:CHAT domain-containing protein [Nonomuraea sp. M3C6]|uniref:CHAT domain-containing protein n=1 Tax=Nonomuraea marmarensis TaxID=3351344 RepID=A0ABW7AK42_9ACTN
MTDPAEALAARIGRFEQAADPQLIWDPAALAEAERAMRALAGDRSDATTWRLIGILHLARYRLDQRIPQDAAVAGAFFAAVAVVDPGRLPERLRGSKGPPGDSADTWAGLVEEVFRHVDPATYPHVGLLVHALVRRAMAHPTAEVAERLGRLLLQESMRASDPGWAPGALALLGGGLVRLYGLTGRREAADDAVHVLFRAALASSAHVGELAGALRLAADEELARAYLAAVDAAPDSQDRSQALLGLVDLTRARADESCADGDLLAFIRVGQCALDFWHEQWAHPGVLAPYAAGLVEWFVVTGNEESLEAATEMLEALHVTPGETAQGLGTDQVVRLGLLGDRRWRRYGVTGELTDLDVAVEVMREAVGLASPGHPEHGRLLANLANALLRRATVTGGDPAEPIAAARTALAAHDARDPARAKALLLLGRALNLGLTAETTDEAVAVLREALEAGEPAFRAEAYGLVSEVLRWRGRVEDLHESVLAARQGVELAMKSSRDQAPAPAQRTLCKALLARFSAVGDAHDLGEALTLAGSGDSEMLSELGAVLDDPGPLPLDEQLARSATELALVALDDDVALKLLRFAERGSSSPGEYLLGVASRLAELGRFRLATVVLSRASASFSAAGLRSQEAYALSRQGANLVELGELDEALEAFARSAAVYRSLGEDGAEAEQLSNMGRWIDDPLRAVEHHLRAIALCERSGLAAEEATYQRHAADAYLAAGDPAAAVACAARARELYLSLGQTEPAALALVPAARAAVDQGDLTASGERIAACAIELEAAGAWEDACRTLDAHAVLLSARGHRVQAAACENRLVEIVRRRGQRREPADEWYRIAQRRRIHGDALGAKLAFELAEREYESIGHHDGAGSVRYNLGVLAYTEGAAGLAAEAFGAAGETFAGLRAHAKEAFSLAMRASCLVVLDRFDDALADLERALELAAAEGDLDALLTATLGRASLDVALGEFQSAGERLSSALGPASGDPLKEAVVRDRLAALAARTGDLGAQVEALELAMAGFRGSGQDRLAALASIKLGFALEERGEFRRARTALEEGLTGLGVAGEGLRPEGAPFEVVAAMAGGLDAAVLARLASIQLTMGDLTHGRATLTQALAAQRSGGPGKVAERLELWLRLEEAEASGDLTTARAVAEQALADSGDRSYLLAKLATYCRELGDLTAAYDHAARGYELRDNRVIEHLRNLGTAASGFGRAGEALEHLTRAVNLARQPDSALPAQLVRTLDAFGLFLTGQARWTAAARAYEEGLALVEDPIWRSLRASLLTNRAGLHLKLGELDKAATGYREAISIREELGDRADLADPYADLALVHLLHGEKDEARPLVERALDLERAQGRARGAVLALIMLARLEEPILAAIHLEEALALARDAGFGSGEAIALSDLGALDVATASYARAHRRLSTAIELLEQLGHELELRTVYHNRSTAAESLGDLPGALADAERASSLGHAAARDRTISLAVRLGRGMTAWTHAEQAKSSTLTTQLSHQPAPSGVPAELLETEQSGLDSVQSLMSAARNTRDPAQATMLTERAHTAQADLEALWHRMEPLAPDYVAMRRGTPPDKARLDALVAPTMRTGPLDDATPGQSGATGLLGFHVGEDAVTVLAHRTGWPEPLAFPTAVGHDLLEDFAASTSGRRPGLLDIEARRHRLELWRRLADLLLAEALEALGDDLTLLYLLPHAGLNRIPLHALAPNGQLLLERFPIAYAPSAAVLTRLTRRGPAEGGRSLALGFTPDADERSVIEGTAEDAAELLGTQFRTGPAATAALLSGTWDVLHLSCQAAFDPDDPFGSGIRLADGLLTARQIMSMRVDARLVILTGTGDRPVEGRAGADDLAALGHALLHAGARSVLLTLWPPADELTRALMRDFHTKLRNGTGQAQALRECVLELHELYGPAEPELWAPYVMVGLPH